MIEFIVTIPPPPRFTWRRLTMTRAAPIVGTRFLAIMLFIGAALLGVALPASGAGPVGGTTAAVARAPAGAWMTQASGTRQPLFAVSCADALHCTAAGAAGTIVATTNGGRNWRPVANPLAGTSTILYRIACVGSATCYIIGRPNVILVTHDAGAHWSVHRISLLGLGPELTDAACVSGQVFDLRGRPALCRLGLLDLACPSASTCLVAATRHVQVPIGDLAPALFLTTNGGATWIQQRIPTTIPCEGDCTPSNARVPYPLDWIACGPGSLCRAGGSTFIGSHEGYAGLVIQAGRPGARWVSVKPIAKTGTPAPAPDAAVCPAAARCYGVWTTSPFQPGNQIWLSTDGGWTWQGMSGGSPRLRNAIACPGAETCYSVGNQGTITAAVNGSPFRLQRSGTSHDLYAVTCVGLQTCYAAGNKGTIVARRAG
jgi:hypothetical protein